MKTPEICIANVYIAGWGNSNRESSFFWSGEVKAMNSSKLLDFGSKVLAFLTALLTFVVLIIRLLK
jgi:hypothetical protein